MSKVKTNAIAAGEPLAPPTGDTGATPSPAAQPDLGAAAGVLAAGALPPLPVIHPITTPLAPAPVTNRPGLETPAVAADPDPFALLQSWKGTTTSRSLRALEVPGGCIIRLSAANGSQLVESLCFVPGVKIANVSNALSNPFLVEA